MQIEHNPYERVDEDLIPAYTCQICKGKVCKDSVGKRIDGFKVVCVDCLNNEDV